MILKEIEIRTENGLVYGEAGVERTAGPGRETDGSTQKAIDGESGGKKRSGSALLTCFLKENTDGKPDAKRKAVIICPGGCYEFCSTREAEPVAFQFLAMDCQAFVLHYSTAPSVFPKALRELAAAVALLRRNAKEWRIDSKQIFVCGFSAGGHLAASLGVFWNRNFVSGPLRLNYEDVRPGGLILAYPVISSGVYGHEGSFDNLTGAGREWIADSSAMEDSDEFPKDPARLRGFLSLERQAGPQVPPVFMWHTDTDATVPVENSLLFAMALKKAGVGLELHIFPEGRHGLALASEETAKDMDDGRGSYTVPCCRIWTKLAEVWLSRTV